MFRPVRKGGPTIQRRTCRPLRFEALESRRMMAAFDVLVFSRTAGFRHDSIDEGVAAIQVLGAAHDFSVTHTEDPAAFADANLAQFEAVVFLSTTGDVLDTAQQTAFENYIRAGGGYVGVHSAADTEYGWAWYGDLMGAYFSSHPAIQSATIKVADHVHASTAHLPDRWMRTDEWYTYQANPRGDVHVLMTLDEASYTGGVGGNGGVDHPISWYHYFDGGRSWYTGLGHTAASYSEPLFLQHLLGGIRFAAGHAPADLGATVEANWRKVVLEADVSNGVSLAVAPTGEVFFVELGGKVKVYHPATGLTTLAGTIPVYNGDEDGLLAIALDPNFSENRWLYLYYSPAGSAQVQHLSRFTMDDGTLDLGSKIVMLEVPVNRGNSGHAGGSLAFGPDGLLYLSTGDDTNPFDQPTTFQTDGYTPIDERPGFEGYDAQRASGNTNDLRGKILRIKPEADGSYTIPAGNLFAGDATHWPEIYTMGHRNPYRISIDSETGWLYWGDVGPDASNDSATRGPRGYDEINQARAAGNFGWPYVIADNKAYFDFNFDTGVSGTAFDPNALVNNSPNNTGALALPAAEPAFIWYPYSNNLAANPFPEMRTVTTGTSSRTAMAGPVYHFDASLDSDIKLPEYFDDTLFIYDWSRRAFWEVKLDPNGEILKINRIWSSLTFARPIEAELGPDGAMYVLEWGSAFGGNNADAQLSRVEFVGNLPTLLGDFNQNNVVDAADYTNWRDTLGQAGLAPFAGADGNGNGKIDAGDFNAWKFHFGKSLPVGGSGAVQLVSVVRPVRSPAAAQSVRAAWPGAAETPATATPAARDQRANLQADRMRLQASDDGMLAWLATRRDRAGSRLRECEPIVGAANDRAIESLLVGLPTLATPALSL